MNRFREENIQRLYQAEKDTCPEWKDFYMMSISCSGRTSFTYVPMDPKSNPYYEILTMDEEDFVARRKFKWRLVYEGTTEDSLKESVDSLLRVLRK